MKKAVRILAAAALVLSAVACSSAKKMAELADNVIVNCDPAVLECVAGNIDPTVSVTYPANYFHPKAILEVTPVIVYDGGEAKMSPLMYQGEKVKDNYKVVPKAGSTVTEKLHFNYVEGMEQSHLELRGVAKYKGKSIKLPTKKVADGVNTTYMLVKGAGIVPMKADGYEAILKQTAEGQILYRINSADVQNKQLKGESIKNFQNALDEIKNNERKTLVGTEVVAYASPDGAEGLNKKLSDNRSKTADKLLHQIADLEKSIMMSSKIASAFGPASDLEDMLDLIEEYAREIENCNGFYLALSDSWCNLSDKILTLTASTDSISYEKSSDTLTMYLAMQNGKRLPSCTFKNNTLLPDFLMSDKENAIIVSPIYNHAGSIGYIVMTFENNRIKYPFKLIQYLVNLSQLLNNIRNRKKSDAMATHLEELYMKDELTGLYSSAGFEYYKNKNSSDSIDDSDADNILMIVDTEDLDSINKDHGQEAGNFAISVIGQAIRNSIPEGAIAGRINKGTFNILLNKDAASTDEVKKKILTYLDNYNRLNPKEYKISARI
ncbi:MAG: GGDEF domain-containing protein [Bacteroidales bacterium]|nr:GGDEF domain-containing protein [Bacteroidales bacterium]